MPEAGAPGGATETDARTVAPGKPRSCGRVPDRPPPAQLRESAAGRARHSPQDPARVPPLNWRGACGRRGPGCWLFRMGTAGEGMAVCPDRIRRIFVLRVIAIRRECPDGRRYSKKPSFNMCGTRVTRPSGGEPVSGNPTFLNLRRDRVRARAVANETRCLAILAASASVLLLKDAKGVYDTADLRRLR